VRRRAAFRRRRNTRLSMAIQAYEDFICQNAESDGSKFVDESLEVLRVREQWVDWSYRLDRGTWAKGMGPDWFRRGVIFCLAQAGLAPYGFTKRYGFKNSTFMRFLRDNEEFNPVGCSMAMEYWASATTAWLCNRLIQETLRIWDHRLRLGLPTETIELEYLGVVSAPKHVGEEKRQSSASQLRDGGFVNGPTKTVH